MKKEPPQVSGESAADMLEYTVGVMETTFNVKVARGSYLSDLLQKVQERATEQGVQNFRPDEFLMRLNDRDIEFEKGKLKEDPILAEAGVLSLVVKGIKWGNVEYVSEKKIKKKRDGETGIAARKKFSAEAEDLFVIGGIVIAVLFALGMVFGSIPVNEMTIGVLGLSAVAAGAAMIIKARSKRR